MIRGLAMLVLAMALLLWSTKGVAQDQEAARFELQWFKDAKLGMFIHWGIYSVKGVDESWSFYNKKIGYGEYMKQMEGFTAKDYDPAAWADLISRSGARYAVITTKHHDGVALYDTKLNERSVVRSSPAKRDVISPFFAELRDRGIRCGAYYSLIDWSDEDYPAFVQGDGRYTMSENPAGWERFRDFYQGQISEIAAQLKPDLWWFDGDWEHSAEEWEAAEVRKEILKANPRAIINGRLAGFGDYATPEQNIPIETPTAPAWELCMTLGEQWGWQPQDTNYKSTHDLIHIFADVIGHGGNLLLGIGPKEDGSFTAGQVSRLEDLGQWTRKHAEAIYSTVAGLPNGHFFGPTTLSKDSTTIHLFLSQPAGGSVEIKGLDNKILSVEVLGKAMPLVHRVVGKISWSKVPGLVFIDVPEAAADEWMTVLKVKLDGPLRLYRGQGGF